MRRQVFVKLDSWQVVESSSLGTYHRHAVQIVLRGFTQRWALIICQQLVHSLTQASVDVRSRGIASAINDLRGKVLLLAEEGASLLQLEEFTAKACLRERTESQSLSARLDACH